MTNKYSELSDFKLTKLVAEQLFKDYPNITVGDETYRTKVGIYNNGNLSQEYDLFYNSSDAFDLITGNNMSLIFLNKIWKAINRKNNIVVYNDDPCRAIAECYLLMKDAESNNV